MLSRHTVAPAFPAHSPSFAHARHAPVPVSQIDPAALPTHSAFVVHAMHVCVAVSQLGLLLPQCAFSKHATHVMVVSSQCGRAPGHTTPQTPPSAGYVRVSMHWDASVTRSKAESLGNVKVIAGSESRTHEKNQNVPAAPNVTAEELMSSVGRTRMGPAAKT